MFTMPQLPLLQPPPTIIIGPSSLTNKGGQKRRSQHASNQQKEAAASHHQESHQALQYDLDYEDDDEMDEEDYEAFEGMMLSGAGGGFYGGDDFIYPPTTWDLIIRNAIPRLPQLDFLLHKYQVMLKNKKFLMQQNETQYNPPFLIIYSKHVVEEAMHKAQAIEKAESKGSKGKEGSASPVKASEEGLTIANYNEALLIPHQFELMRFFEHYHMMKYPKEPIRMLKRKFFIVQYDPDLIHATDGLGSGLVIAPVQGNFLLKVYTPTSEGGKHHVTYGSIVKGMMELVQLIQKG
ncbi:hypothetical protein FGO68_gene81 [Halteria grandinella]|uniref:Uncharacterized protein n=1 Tax=Halteria grandinella TaxID=5974 RepID=A0A8J8NTQ0_HALGN|nr:hypothetical protein FGO68_gene81 [Halteria grandinella]